MCSGISRAEPRVELARITEADAHGRPEVLERLQCYLLDAGAAWDDADAGARNRLARALFETVSARYGWNSGRGRTATRCRSRTSMKAETPTPTTDDRRCHTQERGGALEGIRTRIRVPGDISEPRAISVV